MSSGNLNKSEGDGVSHSTDRIKPKKKELSRNASNSPSPSPSLSPSSSQSGDLLSSSNVTLKIVCKKLTQTTYGEKICNLIFDFFSKEDPLLRYSIPDPQKRHTFVKEYFAPKWTQYTLQNGNVWGVIEEGNLAGISVFFSPDDKFEISLLNVLKEAIETPIKTGLASFNKYMKAHMKVQKTQKKVIGKQPHYRIMYPTMAVYDPAVAHELIKYIINSAYTDNLPIYHEVFTLEHLEFFQNYGFEVVDQIVITPPSETKEKDNKKEKKDKKPKKIDLQIGEEGIKLWALVKYPKKEELKVDYDANESGTVIISKNKSPNLSLAEKISNIDSEEWEKNILSLEKGEYNDGMVGDAFRKYIKTRKSLPSVFLKEAEDSQ